MTRKAEPLQCCGFAQQQKNSPIVSVKSGEIKGANKKDYRVVPMQLCYRVNDDEVCTKTYVTDTDKLGNNFLTRDNFVGVSINGNDHTHCNKHEASRYFSCAVSGVVTVAVPYSWLKYMPVGTPVRGIAPTPEFNKQTYFPKEVADSNFYPAHLPEPEPNCRYIFPFALMDGEKMRGEVGKASYAIGTVVEHPDPKHPGNWVKIAIN